MALHLYEFLFRGRPVGSKEPPAYHVILADDGLDAFGRPSYVLSPALTPEQAEKLGFGFPEILESLDAGLKVELSFLRSENERLRAEADNSGG